MKPLLFVILSGCLALGAEAQESAPVTLEPIAAETVELDDFRWEKRPVVVFADSPNDPAFRTQLQYLTEDPDELIKRDVVILTDTDPATPSDARRRLRPRGFSMVLLDKDGTVKLRKPLPWRVREIVRAIDKFPLRREELRMKRLGDG
ncbi:DUF4174 domain-containing protein [Defluviimonas sp. WL0024]|uniref:DUF4174 domain-containing protein n=2 Tax=Albidovulum TaxID=205889 RepID=A0ABT3J0X8_9RHOB|nr:MULTISPECIES: DUF4174 domain-containing protein [Defluviimonas]MCU9847060.1 DUF4174 domain-containing protein [Defluviimonas sp. WL0024]MCW3781320.1 DUF4174 domain-containing protein [Defluviimonas salinarum]